MTATSVPGDAPTRSVTQRQAVGETLTGGEASILDLTRGFGVTVGPSFVLDVAGGCEKDEREAAFLVLNARALDHAELVDEEIERGGEIADADHGMEEAHGGG